MEATRLEANGDYAKGDALRKEAISRNDEISKTNMSIGEKLSTLSESTLTRLTSSHDAMLGRKQTAKDALEGRRLQSQAIASAREDALAENQRRHLVEERQRLATFQQTLEAKHPLMVKGTLPNALTQLEDLRTQLAAKPNDNKIKTAINALQSQVDTMQDKVINDSQASAKRMMGTDSGFTYKGIQ